MEVIEFQDFLMKSYLFENFSLQTFFFLIFCLLRSLNYYVGNDLLRVRLLCLRLASLINSESLNHFLKYAFFQPKKLLHIARQVFEISIVFWYFLFFLKHYPQILRLMIQFEEYDVKIFPAQMVTP